MFKNYFVTSLYRSIALSILLSFLLSSCQWKDPKGSMMVMTLNARYDNPADVPNDWKSRRPVIITTILDNSADIIGFQEVLKNQLDDLDSLLPWYDYIGVGREDGIEKGEFCPIFFKMNRFEVMDHGTFWLSETPADTGSIGWDAALPRIATWVKFRDLHLNRKGNFFEFYLVNTHFDHMGDTARAMSAKLIMKFAVDSTEGRSVVVTGDFNCSPPDTPYAIITQATGGLPSFIDACGPTLTGLAVSEPTFNGFGHSEENHRIDYIFLSGNWDIFSYETLQILKDGIYISDHWPVVSRIKVKNF